MQSSTTLLQTRLRPLVWRLRLRDTLGWLQRTAYIPGTGFIFIQAVGRLLPIPALVWWSCVPLAAWLIALLVYLVVHRVDAFTAARRVDHLLDLRERLSTALELGRRPLEDEVEERQHSDALHTSERIQPRHLGWAFDRRTLLHFAVPLAVGLALVFLPNPQNAVLAQQAAVVEAIDGTIKTIEAQREAIGQNEELSAAERERLQQELAQLERDLQAAQNSREEALAQLSSAEARLRQELDPQSDARRAGLEQLARRLQSERTGEASNANASNAADELRQQQQNLDNLTAEQREQLAQALREQAAANASVDPTLARELQAAADALSNGDVASASESMDRAAQQAANSNQQLAANDAGQESISQLQEGRESIAQAGQQGQQVAQGQQGQGQQGQGQQGQGQQGQGQGQQGQGQGQQGQSQGQQGQGQGQQGQGQGQQGQGQQGQQGQGQQGQGQGQGGSNANNLGNGTNPNSGNVTPNGQGQSQGDGSGNPTVYQPFQPSGEPGTSENVQGQQGSGGQTQVKPGQYAPGASNPSLVPYEQVYGEYRDAASDALDRSAIPPHLKGYVRDYFGELAPGQ